MERVISPSGNKNLKEEDLDQVDLKLENLKLEDMKHQNVKHRDRKHTNLEQENLRQENEAKHTEEEDEPKQIKKRKSQTDIFSKGGHSLDSILAKAATKAETQKKEIFLKVARLAMKQLFACKGNFAEAISQPKENVLSKPYPVSAKTIIDEPMMEIIISICKHPTVQEFDTMAAERGMSNLALLALNDAVLYGRHLEKFSLLQWEPYEFKVNFGWYDFR